MVKSPDEMLRMGAQMAQTGNTVALTMLDGFRRLTEINMQAARSSLEQSAEQIGALLQAKDVNTLTQLVASYAQPSPEKFTAYAQAVAAVARDTQGNLTAVVREQIARANQQLTESIETLARNAPAGGEGTMGFIRQAMATANQTYEQLNQNLQRVMDMGAQAGNAAAQAATPAKRAR